MSSPGFDDVLKRKINELDLEYNPALWEHLLKCLPQTLSTGEFDNMLRQQMNDSVFAYHAGHWEQLAEQLPLTLGTDEFDRNIKHKADISQLDYHSESWLRFSPQLPFPVIKFSSRRNTLKRLSSIAAIFMIAVAATIFLMNKKQQDGTLAVRQHATGRQTIPSILHADTVLTRNITSSTIVGIHSKNKTNTAVTAPVIPYNYSTAKPLVTPSNTIFNSIPQENITLNPVQKPAISLQITPDNSNTDNSTVFNDPHTSGSSPEMYYPDSYYPEQNKKLYYHKTSLALNGGANYGTFKQGVTVGFSARHFVNDKIFIDGAIAMMINHGDDNTLNYTGDVMKDVFSHNTASGRAARPSGTYYNVNNFYYIQLNPSVGTKLSKRFMLSTGPDFQQLLTSSPDPTVMFKDHDVKLVPNFDVGLTGKAEFFVSPSIQTGIIYRQGVNNIIRNNNDYLNRNYFQVELKYTLPLSIAQ